MKMLRDNKGESLTEVLVAALVIALAMILVVNMVTASSKLVKQSETTFKSNMQEKNAAEYGGSDGTADTTALPTAGAQVQFSSGKLTDSAANGFTWSESLKPIGVTVIQDKNGNTSLKYTETN
ncbi:MAG: hypothetical protein LKE64_05545 [Solobacterium sp.]|jgi:Tfp pilus assembly protein PilV|nr:hypothetical protein [Solobacterium sp.]MCH4050205.1 hypothetical protein [Solobacterium sp.]MCH4073936.1 hypothetical protein [Solobacterium sp.]MCI1313472.1 hypothetical protein [Solobacterium sp.]MCI1345772.1 hypothetical protein [Solobacterium sp.]